MDESGTLQPGLYQLYALGVGCCSGADADWSFDATFGTPPAPVPALPGAGLAWVAVGLAGAALAALRRPGRR